ncbi:hypothetical protein CXG81DRAFT_26803 [Caulochytrium protostelioides]|uniref:RAVE complex protein Rav1 C-terminal domain-containing protein n=1 Tax=Caulochytrium protostelioides TaxID=1555241 RepID=A0A4P9X5T0_9FUNG|nr:hypothetical protein CXG81DRAFT_26803 [Caulochytrium protostelioides]|eukprot:RKP00488.1 hypothetical protein CXG81DRAFT_26803 [Caulochytrium protostelioides]
MPSMPPPPPPSMPSMPPPVPPSMPAGRPHGFSVWQQQVAKRSVAEPPAYAIGLTGTTYFLVAGSGHHVRVYDLQHALAAALDCGDADLKGKTTRGTDIVHAVAAHPQSGHFVALYGALLILYHVRANAHGQLSVTCERSWSAGDPRARHLAWSWTGCLAVAGDTLSLDYVSDQAKRPIQRVFASKMATPVRLAKWSHQGYFLCTVGTHDSQPKVWFERTSPTPSPAAAAAASAVAAGSPGESTGTGARAAAAAAATSSINPTGFPASELQFDFAYLPHPEAVTQISWRRAPKRQRTPAQSVLLTCAEDGVCRIWAQSEARLPYRFTLLTTIVPGDVPPSLDHRAGSSAAQLQRAPNRRAQGADLVFWIPASEVHKAIQHRVELTLRQSQKSRRPAQKSANQIVEETTTDQLQAYLQGYTDLLFQVDACGHIVVWGIQTLVGDMVRTPKPLVLCQAPSLAKHISTLRFLSDNQPTILYDPSVNQHTDRIQAQLAMWWADSTNCLHKYLLDLDQLFVESTDIPALREDGVGRNGDLILPGVGHQRLAASNDLYGSVAVQDAAGQWSIMLRYGTRRMLNEFLPMPQLPSPICQIAFLRHNAMVVFLEDGTMLVYEIRLRDDVKQVHCQLEIAATHPRRDRPEPPEAPPASDTGGTADAASASPPPPPPPAPPPSLVACEILAVDHMDGMLLGQVYDDGILHIHHVAVTSKTDGTTYVVADAWLADYGSAILAHLARPRFASCTLASFSTQSRLGSCVAYMGALTCAVGDYAFYVPFALAPDPVDAAEAHGTVDAVGHGAHEGDAGSPTSPATSPRPSLRRESHTGPEHRVSMHPSVPAETEDAASAAPVKSKPPPTPPRPPLPLPRRVTMMTPAVYPTTWPSRTLRVNEPLLIPLTGVCLAIRHASRSRFVCVAQSGTTLQAHLWQYCATALDAGALVEDGAFAWSTRADDAADPLCAVSWCPSLYVDGLLVATRRRLTVWTPGAGTNLSMPHATRTWAATWVFSPSEDQSGYAASTAVINTALWADPRTVMFVSDDQFRAVRPLLVSPERHSMNRVVAPHSLDLALEAQLPEFHPHRLASYLLLGKPEWVELTLAYLWFKLQVIQRIYTTRAPTVSSRARYAAVREMERVSLLGYITALAVDQMTLTEVRQSLGIALASLDLNHDMFGGWDDAPHDDHASLHIEPDLRPAWPALAMLDAVDMQSLLEAVHRADPDVLYRDLGFLSLAQLTALVHFLAAWHAATPHRATLDTMGFVFVVLAAYNIRSTDCPAPASADARRPVAPEDDADREPRLTTALASLAFYSAAPDHIITALTFNPTKDAAVVAPPPPPPVAEGESAPEPAAPAVATAAEVTAMPPTQLPWTWSTARLLNGGLWLSRDVTLLRQQVEVMARNQFLLRSDPADCMLFYLLLRKHTVLLRLWKIAHGHADQAAMTRFLLNDFAEQRWQHAAVKNAFALLGKQRYSMAAAFFLLAEKPRECMGVLIQQLHDFQLALVVATLWQPATGASVPEDASREALLSMVADHIHTAFVPDPPSCLKMTLAHTSVTTTVKLRSASRPVSSGGDGQRDSNGANDDSGDALAADDGSDDVDVDVPMRIMLASLRGSRRDALMAAVRPTVHTTSLRPGFLDVAFARPTVKIDLARWFVYQHLASETSLQSMREDARLGADADAQRKLLRIDEEVGFYYALVAELLRQAQPQLASAVLRRLAQLCDHEIEVETDTASKRDADPGAPAAPLAGRKKSSDGDRADALFGASPPTSPVATTTKPVRGERAEDLFGGPASDDDDDADDLFGPRKDDTDDEEDEYEAFKRSLALSGGDGGDDGDHAASSAAGDDAIHSHDNAGWVVADDVESTGLAVAKKQSAARIVTAAEFQRVCRTRARLSPHYAQWALQIALPLFLQDPGDALAMLDEVFVAPKAANAMAPSEQIGRLQICPLPLQDALAHSELGDVDAERVKLREWKRMYAHGCQDLLPSVHIGSPWFVQNCIDSARANADNWLPLLLATWSPKGTMPTMPNEAHQAQNIRVHAFLENIVQLLRYHCTGDANPFDGPTGLSNYPNLISAIMTSLLTLIIQALRLWQWKALTQMMRFVPNVLTLLSVALYPPETGDQHYTASEQAILAELTDQLAGFIAAASPLAYPSVAERCAPSDDDALSAISEDLSDIDTEMNTRRKDEMATWLIQGATLKYLELKVREASLLIDGTSEDDNLRHDIAVGAALSARMIAAGLSTGIYALKQRILRSRVDYHLVLQLHKLEKRMPNPYQRMLYRFVKDRTPNYQRVVSLFWPTHVPSSESHHAEQAALAAAAAAPPPNVLDVMHPQGSLLLSSHRVRHLSDCQVVYRGEEVVSMFVLSALNANDLAVGTTRASGHTGIIELDVPAAVAYRAMQAQAVASGAVAAGGPAGTQDDSLSDNAGRPSITKMELRRLAAGQSAHGKATDLHTVQSFESLQKLKDKRNDKDRSGKRGVNKSSSSDEVDTGHRHFRPIRGVSSLDAHPTSNYYIAASNAIPFPAEAPSGAAASAKHPPATIIRAGVALYQFGQEQAEPLQSFYFPSTPTASLPAMLFAGALPSAHRSVPSTASIASLHADAYADPYTYGAHLSHDDGTTRYANGSSSANPFRGLHAATPSALGGSGASSSSTSSSYPRLSRCRFSPFGTSFGAVDTKGYCGLWRFDFNPESRHPRNFFQAHTYTANDLMYMNSSTFLATGGKSLDQANLCFWDVLLPPAQSRIKTFAMGDSSVQTLAFSTRHNLLVAGTRDGAIRLIDIRQRAIMNTFRAHDHAIRALAIDPAADCLVSGSVQGDLSIWNLQAFERVDGRHGIHAAVVADLDATALGQFTSQPTQLYLRDLGPDDDDDAAVDDDQTASTSAAAATANAAAAASAARRAFGGSSSSSASAAARDEPRADPSFGVMQLEYRAGCLWACGSDGTVRRHVSAMDGFM